MKLYTFFICTFVLLLSSCVQKQVHHDVEISIGKSEEQMEIKDYWNKAQVIPLIEDSVDVLGDVSKIRYGNGTYFVLNGKKTIIKQYNAAGRCLSTINSQGNAHNEYLQIIDFDVTDDSVYISCYPNKILVADMTGKIKNVINTDLMIADLACYKEKLYGYVQNDRGVYVYENEMWENIFTAGNLPACPHSPNMNVFHKTDGKLYCITEGGDKMYEIKDKTASCLFTMNYPDKEEINARMKENRPLEGLERVKSVPIAVTSFVSTKDCYVMTYTCEALVRGCVIDKSTLSLKKDGWWYGTSPTPMTSSPEGSLAAKFISQDDMPIDTTNIKISYTSKPNWSDGQLAIIKYLDK